MGYYNNEGVWMEGNPPPAAPLRMPRQMRPAAERQNDSNPGVRQQARRELRQGHYDQDGNWIEPEPANTAETFDDVGRSAVTGVQRGAAGMAGMFGDVQELGAQAAGVVNYWAQRAGGANDEEARARTQEGIDAARTYREARNMQLPRTEDINAAIEQVAGPQHEPETTAGEYARTVGEFAPALLFPEGRAASVGDSLIQRGVNAAGTAARRATTEVVAPGVVSEAAGQVTEDTPIEAPARIIGALLGAGVSQNTLNILTRQGLTPDERALRLIRRELTDAGYSPDEVRRVANRLLQQAPTEEVLGELMGPSGQRLMRATAAMGRGSGRTIAEDTLAARATGRRGPVNSQDPSRRGVTSIRDRVTAEAARTFAPEQTHAPNNYWDHLDALRSARQSQAIENYRTAYAQEIDQNLVGEHLTPLMTQAPDAAKSGVRQLDFEERRLLGRRSQVMTSGEDSAGTLAQIDADLQDVRNARDQLSAIAEGATPSRVNARAIDYFQRGLQQAEQAAGRGSPEAGAIGSFRRGFNGLADNIATGLGDTRSQYGRSMAIEDYTDMGRRVFNMSEGEIDRALRGPSGRGLTTEEFDGFQLGVLDAIENKLGQGDTAFLARLARNANWRAQLERATGGPAEAKRFMARLAREANMQGTRNYVLAGSRTEPLKEDIRALTQGESELSFIADQDVKGVIEQVGRSAKNPFDASVRLATWLYDRFHRPGIANPQVQEAMARRLFARVTRESSKELRDALLSIPERQDAHPALRAFVRGLLATQATDDQPAPEPR